MVRIIKEQCGDNDFLSISAHMEGRNQMQCFLRWRNTLRPGIKMREKFTPEEDICLYLAVKSRGTKWKDLVPHLDDVTGPGRTDLTVRDRFINFMDPKLLYRDFTKTEEKALDKLMWKHFAERINPPPEMKKKKYCLNEKEWRFLARKLSTKGNRKSGYQVKRTWHSMRRRIYLRMRRRNLANFNRSPKRKPRYFLDPSFKRAKMSSPEAIGHQSSEEDEILDLDFSTTDSLSSPVVSKSASPASSKSPSKKVLKKRQMRTRGMARKQTD